MTGKKRRFGTVRQLASGRWQVRYTGPDGLRRLAPHTFDNKKAADRWLVQLEAEMLRGDWLDPDVGRIPLAEYAERWLRERELKARTREEYARHLRLHVAPYLGASTLSEVTPPHVRAWRADRLAGGVGSSTVAKTYRILHAIFATAVDDDLIRRSPCRIRRGGQDKADERPTVTLDQSSRSRGQSNPGIGFWSSWPRSRNCALASSLLSGGGISTWPRWSSAS